MFNLKNATDSNLKLLTEFKLRTIFESDNDNNINEDEKIKIINYVNESTAKHLDDYKLIMVKDIIAGAFLTYEYEDGILIDEIYLLEEYRNLGIGTKIIKDVIENNHIIYLWVYKTNTKAIKLYSNLNFKIIEETETRYKMILNKN